MTQKYHHLTSRYARLTPSTIDFCIETVRDAHEVLHDHEALRATEMVLVAQEVLANERWAEQHLAAFPEGDFRGLGDFALVCIADGFDQAAPQIRARGATERADSLRRRARLLLREVAASPVRSPLVAYEDVFLDLCSGTYDARDREDLPLHTLSLLFSLDFAEWRAADGLRRLASLHYRQGQLDRALAMFRELLVHEPEDAWGLLSLAELCSAVHPEIARAAVERGIALDDESARAARPALQRVRDAVAGTSVGPRTNAAVTLLADLLVKPARSRRSLRKLCTTLVPELARPSPKALPPLPDAASLDALRLGLGTLPRPLHPSTMAPKHAAPPPSSVATEVDALGR